MSRLCRDDLVRGQFRGCMDEPGVAAQSVTESFAAVRFQIWTWRRNGPAGNCLPANAPEVVVRFTQPPFTLFNVIEKASGHRVRFRLGLDISIGTGARRKVPGNKIRGEAVELTALGVGHGEMTPYERLRRRHGRRPPVRHPSGRSRARTEICRTDPGRHVHPIQARHPGGRPQ
ncbi:hypothetical protein [Rhizobium ruizarguesonis]|uniref:hypothetical protein n=1 Tax=Rhizobium ruizarguesonis TaxID=2081791 RepID=UPI00247990A5|nr:hypothetical protein [Rhizobium ruizarguesonis]